MSVMPAQPRCTSSVYAASKAECPTCSKVLWHVREWLMMPSGQHPLSLTHLQHPPPGLHDPRMPGLEHQGRVQPLDGLRIAALQQQVENVCDKAHLQHGVGDSGTALDACML
jgi:hypothetical protein